MTVDNKVLQAIFRLGKYLSMFLAFFFISTPLHEWFHLLMAKALGGDGHIIRAFWGGAIYYTKTPSLPILVTFMGGLGVAAIYSLIFIFDWYSEDLIGACAILPLVTGQFVYGLAEGIFLPTMSLAEFSNVAGIATVIGFGIGFAISAWIALNHIVKDM